MKVLLAVAGVLGLAMIFGSFEPAPASHAPVLSSDVRLVSEEISDAGGPHGFGRNARQYALRGGRLSR